jgi:hypothetical protein
MANDIRYWNDQVELGQCVETTLMWKITSGPAVSNLSGPVALTSFGAVASQAVIDAFLGTTSEFDYLAFDATSLGADTFAAIVNMGGQVQDLVAFEWSCFSSAAATSVTRKWYSSATLTNTSLVTQGAKGADGNVAFKVDFGNSPDFDALSDGIITLKFYWHAK